MLTSPFQIPAVINISRPPLLLFLTFLLLLSADRPSLTTSNSNPPTPPLHCLLQKGRGLKAGLTCWLLLWRRLSRQGRWACVVAVVPSHSLTGLAAETTADPGHWGGGVAVAGMRPAGAERRWSPTLQLIPPVWTSVDLLDGRH